MKLRNNIITYNCDKKSLMTNNSYRKIDKTFHKSDVDLVKIDAKIERKKLIT